MFSFNLDLIKGLFLLILAISANFVGELLGCKTQKLLTENMLAKHIVLLLLIYFTVDLTSSTVSNPMDTLKSTIQLWVFYILFTKLDTTFTSILFLLLFTLYIANNYLEYLKVKTDKSEKEQNYEKKIPELIQLLSKSIQYILLFGFVKYYLKQRNDHKKNFQHTKFFFGTTKCDSLK